MKDIKEDDYAETGISGQHGLFEQEVASVRKSKLCGNKEKNIEIKLQLFSYTFRKYDKYRIIVIVLRNHYNTRPEQVNTVHSLCLTQYTACERARVWSI